MSAASMDRARASHRGGKVTRLSMSVSALRSPPPVGQIVLQASPINATPTASSGR